MVLTKPLGTGVLTTALKQQKLEPALLRKVTRQMATLNRRAAEAAVEFGARAATDVTGFGLLGHGSQLAEASGVTLRLRPLRSWFLPRVLGLALDGVVAGGLRRNREFYGASVDLGDTPEDVALGLFDPQTSGGLLIAVPPRRVAALRAALARARGWSAELGEVVPQRPHRIELVWSEDGHRAPGRA
jgi:selenide,water dikinase